MTRRSPETAARAAAAILLAALAGCAAGTYAIVPPTVTVAASLPRPVAAGEGDACDEGQARVESHYDWNGKAWVLVEGGCYVKPGYEWVPPDYAPAGAGVAYRKGYWKPVTSIAVPP